VFLFDQDGLEKWLKQGRLNDVKIATLEPKAEADEKVVEISQQRIYPRSARYR
jgi:hypothetical protein